ncbi:MAG: STAS domain-containing protein [Leptospiraceae bacterium]|nr:STAS domain-containing protein [Leptospiraceae bacterium]MCP5513306.1 STAS domain-containing protein [Leptospiraceae bacterium]
MKLTFKKQKDYIVIYLSGSLDTKISRDIEEDFEQILTNHPKTNILLNMKELKYISSSGLRIIVSLRSALQAANLKFKICNMGKNVREIFELTKVVQFFKIYEDEESALLSINELDSDYD